MKVELAKNAADFGILINDAAASLAFYRDLLGLEYAGEIALPADWQGTMHVLRCGASLVKLVRLDDIPNARPTQPEQLEAATGLRYWTIPVVNHDEVVTECERAGVPIVKRTVHVPESGARFTLLADPAADIESVGAFEGGNYLQSGMYRPQMDCIMFSRNPVPFCADCRETLDGIIDLYTEASAGINR